MQIVTARSTTALPSMMEGPTMTLINRNVHVETVVDETTKASHDEWVATQYRLPAGEYAMVRAGILPEGATWDAELRRIERSALLDDADRDIAEAQDYIQSGASGWEEYVTGMRSYKMAVRETVEQAGFPLSVTYPEVPSKP